LNARRLEGEKELTSGAGCCGVPEYGTLRSVVGEHQSRPAADAIIEKLYFPA
jgi:hypothetical protein